MSIEPEASVGESEPETASAPLWNVYEVATRDDPHAGWRAIRERDPLVETEAGVWFASSWTHAEAILKDVRFGAGSGVAASFGAEAGRAAEVMSTWLMSHDGVAHDRARALVRRSFTPRATDTLAPIVERIVYDCVARVDAKLAQGPVDLVAELAFALPSEVMRHLFGQSSHEWEPLVAQVRELPNTPGASLAMIDGLADAFASRLREAGPRDGLLAALGAPDDAGDSLSTDEIVANAVLLLTAGLDTTAGLIANAIHLLLEHPAQAERIARDPAHAARVVEETLRFEPPAISCSRRALASTEIAGRTIPADANVLLGLAAANRDPARFPDPDRFDPDRDLSGLLSFGGGRHVCLGAPLARLEARLALASLFGPDGPAIERIEPPRWQRRNPTVRALERLPVRLAPERP